MKQITEEEAVAVFRKHEVFLYPMKPAQCAAVANAVQKQTVERLAALDREYQTAPDLKAAMQAEIDELRATIERQRGVMRVALDALVKERDIYYENDDTEPAPEHIEDAINAMLAAAPAPLVQPETKEPRAALEIGEDRCHFCTNPTGCEHDGRCRRGFAEVSEWARK